MSLNVCLYGPGAAWAMTERGRDDLRRDRDAFELARSRVAWEDEALVVRFDERAVPVPRRVRGTVRLRPDAINERAFAIGEGHCWRPVAPSARIELDAPELGLSWRGHGYHDTNWGSEGLEHAFRRWDWSRARRPGGGCSILYDVERRDGSDEVLALRFGSSGEVDTFAPPPRAPLRRGLWGVRRSVRCDGGKGARIVRSLEDAPFYTRAELHSRLCGEDVVGVHETFDGDRFASAWVKGLLPFRMPRRVSRR